MRPVWAPRASGSAGGRTPLYGPPGPRTEGAGRVTHIDLSEEQPGLPAGTGSVFRNRNFVLLWSAQVLSQLASNMVLAALMAVVVGATSSNTANALLILTFLAPAVVFSALAGVLVERSDARLIMIAANLGRAVGTALFIVVGANV